jgi:predicted TIM-barrel fold metal-dependent hydrolase
MKFLTDEQLRVLLPAETSSFPSPVPTQIVSSDEYMPAPQTTKQREVEARLKELSDRLARRQGLSRRRFFQTASGMAASFLVMNQVFGRLFEVSEAEAATPDMAEERAKGLANQFIFDGHTHFLRDDTRLGGFEPGWLEQVDMAIEVHKPDSWKGYTIGDNTHKELAHYPYRLDDEKLMYPFYEKAAKAGIKNVCIHKGLFAPAVEEKFPRLRPYADVSDVGKAAKDWPQLNFLIYHSGYRWIGAAPADGMAEFDRTGRSSWSSDLAEIPEKYGVTNVYGDLGQLFAWTAVAEPRLAAALMGMLVKGLGADHVLWGTDAVWTGAPQWQIKGLRRLEIPEEMQKRYGFKPLGPADGPIKNAIFAENAVRLHNFDKRAALAKPDRFAEMKTEYAKNGPGRSNLRYGYVRNTV